MMKNSAAEVQKIRQIVQTVWCGREVEIYVRCEH